MKKKKKGFGSIAPKKKDFKKSTASKRKYFHCNEDGHWKRNCKIYLDFKRKEGRKRRLRITNNIRTICCSLRHVWQLILLILGL